MSNKNLIRSNIIWPVFLPMGQKSLISTFVFISNVDFISTRAYLVQVHFYEYFPCTIAVKIFRVLLVFRDCKIRKLYLSLPDVSMFVKIIMSS